MFLIIFLELRKKGVFSRVFEKTAGLQNTIKSACRYYSIPDFAGSFSLNRRVILQRPATPTKE